MQTARKNLSLIACVVWASIMMVPAVARAQDDQTAPFFDDAIVHDLYFTINTKDWQTLKENYLDNTYYPVDFKWGTQGVRNAGIRSRGTGSRSGEKPGLRLDFDRYTTGQTFLGLKSLIFRNSTQDPTNMHERLAMQLFKKLGLAAPREMFARLFVNNQYSGLYAIVESVDKQFVGKTFGSDTGYIYKYDYNVTDAGYYFTYRTSNPTDYVPLPFKPETHESDPHPEVFERFAWTINNATDASFRSAIAEFMDLTELIRHVASEVYVADNDGFLGNWGMNNYYLYRLATDHVFHFINWDKSEAFKDTPDYWIWHNHLDAADTIKNRLWTRVMSYPDLKNQYLDTLLECAAIATAVPSDAAPGDTRGWLEREIEREYGQINAAVQADTNKPYSNDQFQAAVEFLRSFVRQRPDFVKNQVAASR
jgi:spore coat protein CotH